MNYTFQFISIKTYKANSKEKALEKLYEDIGEDYFTNIIDYEVTEDE